MGIREDFLNRLAQHIDAQRRLLPTQGGNVLDALTLGPRLGLQDVGLALEGTGAVGKGLAGELAYLPALAQVKGAQAGLPGFNPDSTATQASRAAVAAGPGDPGGVIDAFREGPDSLAAWLAGALEMASDPANLIGLPAKGAAVAAKEGRLAGLAGATGDFSPAFIKGGAEEALQKLLEGMGREVAPNELSTGLTNDVPYIVTKDLGAVSRRVNALVNRDRAVKGVAKAEDRLAEAGGLYKDVQAQKAAAVRDLFPDVKKGGRLPAGFRQTPEYAQQVNEAKDAVELLNPRGPQQRAGYQTFVGGRREKLAQMRADADAAQQEFAAAFKGTTGDPLGDVNRAHNVAPGGPEDVVRPTPEQLAGLQGRVSRDPGAPLVGDTAVDVNAATLLPDPEVTLAPGTSTATPQGRARTLYEQLMGDLGPTDDPAAFRKKDAAARAYLKAKGFDYHSSPEEVNFLDIPYAKPGESFNADQAKYLLRGAQDAEFAPNLTHIEGLASPSPVPVAMKTVDNPAYLADVKDQVTQLVNAPVPKSRFPELDNPQGGRMVDLLNHAFKEGLVAMKEAYSRPWKRVGLKDLGSVWYGVNIQTVKNLLQDPIFARFVLRNEGVAKQAYLDNQKIIISRLTRGEKDPLALFGSLDDILTQLGLRTEKTTGAEGQAIMAKLGGNPFDNEATIADELNGMQQALLGAGIQLANPVRAVTGIATMPLNLLIPMRSRMFHIINNVTHVSSRVAAFEQAAMPFLENSAKALLERAAAEGKDISSLVGRDLVRGDDVLATEGMFSWHEVEKALGPRYAAEWRRISEAAMEAGYKNSREVLGNYQLEGALGAAEKQIRRVVPLQSWAWRAYPRAAKYALQHPAVTAGLLHLYALDRHMAQEEGRPGYTVGTIPINSDTPFVGLLASVFTPEQEGEVRFNPLSLFSPLGGDTLSIGMDKTNEPETPYQKVKEVLGYGGMSFNPLIQEGAYLTGGDYQAPAPGSRYSAIDNLAGDVTGATVPTLSGPNRALRAGITKTLGDEQVDTYDPVVNKANELVFESTGKVVSDPSNRALAQDIKDHGPFYQAAQRILDEGGAKRAGFNAIAPVSITSRTDTTAARQAATPDVPFKYEDIKAAQEKGQVQMVKLMQQTNDAYYAQHPEAAVNKKADLPAAVDPRIAKFEAENAPLKKYAPRAYATKLADYKKTLGLR